MNNTLLNVISLGAGVQSTTMALMASNGLLSTMPDCAIFADTQWEPKAVYSHLEWLRSGVLRFPVHIVSAGDLRSDILRRSNTTGGRFAAVPWFTINSDGTPGMGRRQCTSEYKIKPIARKLRDILNVGPKARIKPGTVRMWLGISIDEASRMRPSRVQWIENKWPLIDARMSRRDCLSWLASHGYPTPPKSACIGCPFHSRAHWQNMKRADGDEWRDAVYVDASLRLNGPGHRGMRSIDYMHSNRVPLPTAVESPDNNQIDLFDNECEGMCGV